MASQRLRCKQCHERFSRLQGSRRVYCETCRPPRKRTADVQAPPPDTGPGPLEVAVTSELETAGRLDTIEGVALLVIARDADRLPPDKRAAVVEKLLRVKTLALAGAKGAGPDPVSEIGRRRAERLASA